MSKIRNAGKIKGVNPPSPTSSLLSGNNRNLNNNVPMTSGTPKLNVKLNKKDAKNLSSKFGKKKAPGGADRALEAAGRKIKGGATKALGSMKNNPKATGLAAAGTVAAGLGARHLHKRRKARQQQQQQQPPRRRQLGQGVQN